MQEFIKYTENVLSNLSSFEEDQDFSLSSLLTNESISTHTTLDTVEDFLKVLNVSNLDEIFNLNQDVLDITISNISNYSSFDDFISVISEELIIDKLEI